MVWHIYLLIGFLLALSVPIWIKFIQSYFGLVVALWLGYGLYALNTNLFSAGNIVWTDSFGISFAFILTGISKVFLNIIFLVGASVFIFAASYLKTSDRLNQFFTAFTLFLCAMLGLVTADSFLLTFIFWELTSISSYMLIGYNHEEESARKSALQALITTGAGGLCFFAGLILFQHITGLSSFSELTRIELKQSSLLYTSIILILIGGLTKSAQFPFHFWLPNAMKAPAPVSALLHSATMVKAGIYLFLRLDSIFDQWNIWSHSLTVLGSVTLMLGALTAYYQTDLKKLLAYTTIANLGALTLLIGFQHPMSSQVALVLFVAHALYKAALFMIAGIFEKVTGQRDIQKISGLGKFIPLAWIGGGTAALSMIGIPPTLGFLSKELLLKVGILEIWSLPIWIIGFSLMGSVAWFVGIKPFLGTSHIPTTQLYQPGVLITIGPLILGLSSIVLSFNPFDILGSQLAESLTRDQQSAPLHLWTGLNLPLFLSITVIVLAGLGVYFHPQILSWIKNNHKPSKPLSDLIFDFIFATLLRIASYLTELFQNGNLTRYLLLIFWGLLFFASSLLLKIDILSYIKAEIASELTLLPFALAVIIAICISLIVTTQRRLSAIVSMGGIGYSIAALYVLLGAPDLALTQVIVETLSVILFVFLLHEVPLLKSERKIWPNQGIAAITSILIGLMVSFFTWQSLTSEIAPSISEFFGQNSYLKANGRNIVNVIIVDFRGFDTLGEITVLSIAAVTLTALLIGQTSSREPK